LFLKKCLGGIPHQLEIFFELIDDEMRIFVASAAFSSRECTRKYRKENERRKKGKKK
jgi:hypothetical protein